MNVKEKYPLILVNQFQAGVWKTWDSKSARRERLWHATLALNEEAGEVAGLLKKHLVYGKELDQEKLLLELGDVAYFLTVLALEHDFSLELVFGANREKLTKRYPNGFDKARALVRETLETLDTVEEPK